MSSGDERPDVVDIDPSKYESVSELEATFSTEGKAKVSRGEFSVECDVTHTYVRDDHYDDGRFRLVTRLDVDCSEEFGDFIRCKPGNEIKSSVTSKTSRGKFVAGSLAAKAFAEQENLLETVARKLRREIQEENEFSVTIDEQYERGMKKDRSAVKIAKGRVLFADGREIHLKWSNSVRAGFGVDLTGQSESEFTVDEIDAVVAYASTDDISPIRTDNWGPGTTIPPRLRTEKEFEQAVEEAKNTGKMREDWAQ